MTAATETPTSTAAGTPHWILPAVAHYPRRGSTALRRGATESWAEHLDRFGTQPADATPAELVAELEACALDGRGGAHFPVARKWRTVLGAGPGAIVVANGAEGESLSAKDAAILQSRPHLVLDGAALAAAALAADEAIIWLHEGAIETERAVRNAIGERLAAGVREVQFNVRTGPDHYLTGESSAAMRALSGGPALPTFRRVPGAVSGVDGRPTLLHNVETLARIATVARGIPRFARMPRGGINSAMFTILTPAGRIVTEVRPDTPLTDVVTAHYPTGDLGAVLLGGFGGEWLPWHEFARLHADPAIVQHGHSLGAGIIAPIPRTTCGVAETARILDYLAASSARQCGPCLFGLRAVADLVMSLARGGLPRGDRRKLARFQAEIKGRGGCHHPDGAMNLLASMFNTFPEDIEHHLRKGSCATAHASAVIPLPEI